MPDIELSVICPWHNQKESLHLPPAYGSKKGSFHVPCANSTEFSIYLLDIGGDFSNPDSPCLDKLKKGEEIILKDPASERFGRLVAALGEAQQRQGGRWGQPRSALPAGQEADSQTAQEPEA